jgi:hypothetical protein
MAPHVVGAERRKTQGKRDVSVPEASKSKRTRLLIWGVALLVVLGGAFAVAYTLDLLPWFRSGPQYRAAVQCKKVDEGIRCTVRHTKGLGTGEVCFDLAMICENGTEVLGSGCSQVAKGETRQTLIPASELPDFQRCDKARKVEASNVRAVESLR